MRRSGDRIRVSAQLIYAPTEAALWAQSYERDFKDALTLQSALASDIAEQIRAKISSDQQARLQATRPVNQKALDAYLQGYRESAKKKATEQAQAKAQEEIKKATEKATEEANRTARTKLDTLVSRVDGSFDGIKGRTIIRLEDGTVWKQANVDDHFRAPATEHPTAVVLHTTFGYKMRVEGTQEFYVDPVVRP